MKRYNVKSIAGAVMMAAAGVALALGASSCRRTDRFKLLADLSPEHANATAALETVRNGRWLLVDSLELSSDGRVMRTFAREDYPNIMRITLDGRPLVYFPVDSTEDVWVTLRGAEPRSSVSARIMARVDSLIDAAGQWPLPPAVKKEIGRAVLEEPASIGAYYTISRTVNGQPLYNPSEPSDLRLIGAVANAYSTQRPSDPRTPWLTRQFIGHRRTAGRGDTIVAQAVGAFDLEGYDVKGRLHKLGETAGKGRVTVLNFSAFEHEGWPAVNMMLNDAAKQGAAVWQMAIGDDEPGWREAAAALPWVSVYASPYLAAEPLRTYNVGALPATFILDAHGDVVERVDDLRRLPELVAKHQRK